MAAATIEYVDLPDTLTCGWCKRTDVTKQDLKRCGGCGAVMYCSKHCQREAWPSHKSACRSQDGHPDTGAEQAGYVAPLSLANAVKDWANVHEDAFSMIIHTIVRFSGGVDHVLNNNRCMVFYLRPLRPIFGNPATALEVISLSLVSKDIQDDRFEPIRSQWDAPLKTAREAFAAELARTDPNPRFAGVIPATFIVDDTEVVLHSRYPLYRPKNHADNAPVEESVAAAFNDIQRLCVRSLGAGLVLRHPADPASPLPGVGYMVRQKKKWVWKPMRSPACLMGLIMDEDDRPRRSDLSIQDLWTVWRQW